MDPGLEWEIFVVASMGRPLLLVAVSKAEDEEGEGVVVVRIMREKGIPPNQKSGSTRTVDQGEVKSASLWIVYCNSYFFTLDHGLLHFRVSTTFLDFRTPMYTGRFDRYHWCR